jgi:Cu/Ag efflux pump CusA
VDVTAALAGSSTEEVERQLTIPLEVLLAGMPGLEYTRSQSLPGLAWVRLAFRAGTDRDRTRQEIINRLQSTRALPPAAVPQLCPATAADRLLCYTLHGPRDPRGRDIYTPSDLRALQEWVVERELRRVPGVAEIQSVGGTVKRYEVQPDPDRLRRYGITLRQLQRALADSNAAAGGDYVRQGKAALTVRGVGLLGGGTDPVQQVLGLKDARQAAAKLRAEEQRRVREIRSLVIATINRVPVRVGDVVEGGPLAPAEAEGGQGVVVGHQPRASQVGRRRAGEPDEDDLVQGIVLLRPGAERQRTLRGVRSRIRALNDEPGWLLPGVRIEPCPEPAAASETGPDVLWVRGTFPLGSPLDDAASHVRKLRALLVSRPEVLEVVTQTGRANAGAEPHGFHPVQAMVFLRPATRRTGRQLADDIATALERDMPGMAWEVAGQFRDEMQAAFTAAPGQGLLKIFGPDPERLERLAEKAAHVLNASDEVPGVRVSHLLGRVSLEFRIDPDKCKRWGISPADAKRVLSAALEGTRVTQMVEGEKTFVIMVRWPKWRRGNEESVLDTPVDIPDNAAAKEAAPATPRLRLRDLVSPSGDDGQPDPKGSFLRQGAAVIYHEDGRRLIAIRFRPCGKDAAATLAALRKKLAPLFAAPYRAEWEVGP